MSETITVKLETPIEGKSFDGESKVFKELTFREPTVGDVCLAETVAPKGEFPRLAAILASMAGVDIPTMSKVKMRDFNAIVAAAGGLMGEQRPTENGLN